MRSRGRGPDEVKSSRRMQRQAFVEAAHPVALQIDGHISKANLFELTHDMRPDFGIERPRELVAPNLDASQIAVMPHATHTETEIAQSVFGGLDHAQLRVG